MAPHQTCSLGQLLRNPEHALTPQTRHCALSKPQHCAGAQISRAATFSSHFVQALPQRFQQDGATRLAQLFRERQPAMVLQTGATACSNAEVLEVARGRCTNQSHELCPVVISSRPLRQFQLNSSKATKTSLGHSARRLRVSFCR